MAYNPSSRVVNWPTIQSAPPAIDQRRLDTSEAEVSALPIPTTARSTNSIRKPGTSAKRFNAPIAKYKNAVYEGPISPMHKTIAPKATISKQ